MLLFSDFFSCCQILLNSEWEKEIKVIYKDAILRRFNLKLKNISFSHFILKYSNLIEQEIKKILDFITFFGVYLLCDFKDKYDVSCFPLLFKGYLAHIFSHLRAFTKKNVQKRVKIFEISKV